MMMKIMMMMPSDQVVSDCMHSSDEDGCFLECEQCCTACKHLAAQGTHSMNRQYVFTLRALLSDDHAQVFDHHGVADHILYDHSLEMRLHMIKIQIVAYGVLCQALAFQHPNDPTPHSLSQAIHWAKFYDIISRRQAGILRSLNAEANKAKHDLGFQPLYH